MSFEELPKNLEQGINRFAQDHHLSHDEAVLKLIESGLKIENSEVDPANRPSRPQRGPQSPLRTDNPEKIVGLFDDYPEVVDSILKVVETRSERYSQVK